MQATIVEITPTNSNGILHMFSGGEVHVKIGQQFKGIPIRGNAFILKCTDYTMNGFMQIALANEVFRRLGASHLTLFYPYFPYARQDRVMTEGEPFSLRVFCEMVNNLNLDKVIIHDPHSDVTPALIRNCTVIPQDSLARIVLPGELLDGGNDVFFCAPDAGAFKKLSKLIADDSRIVIGTKHRDPSTGKITGTRVLTDYNLLDKTVVIVDDICDGGRTFIELAKELKSTHAVSKVILYVTHGIFSQGFPPVFEHIDEIYTTDSFWDTYGPLGAEAAQRLHVRRIG